MNKGLHPLVMIALVVAVTLFGRVLPTWTLSLATIAAANALISLGIVVLARTGNVSFGQGLFYRRRRLRRRADRQCAGVSPTPSRR